MDWKLKLKLERIKIIKRKLITDWLIDWLIDKALSRKGNTQRKKIQKFFK